MNSTRAWVGCALFVLLAAPVRAGQTDSDMLSSTGYREAMIAPFALHWRNDADHKPVVMLGLEGGTFDGPVWGAAAFSNSFGEPCAYAYVGWRFDALFGVPNLFAKLTGGLLYGYKGKYERKVPFNHDGWGVAAIPAVGWRITPKDSIQFGLLGTAAAFFAYSRRF
jgi:hypothetical protein